MAQFHSVAPLTKVDAAKCKYQDGVIEIEGVVSLKRQGGWNRGPYHVHCFELAAWRIPGEEVRRNKLTVLRPIKNHQSWGDDFPAGGISRFKILLSDDDSRAIYAGESSEAPTQNDLNAIAKELTQPLVINSERYGKIEFDRSVGWFEGSADWNGQEITVTFNIDSEERLDSAIAVADQLFNDQQSWKRKVDQFAVDELLELKNESWLQDDEETVTPDAFIAKMQLTSVTITPEGNLTFWHDDGDLFWGHSIQVWGSLQDGPTDADIPG